MGKPDGKRPLGRRRRRWKDNIKLYLNKIERKSMKLINLAQRRDRYWAVVYMIMKL